MTRTTPPTRLLDPREDEVVARLHRYATAGAPPMSLATGDVISAARRRTTARRVRGAAVSTLTVVALALGGTYVAGLEHTADDTPAVAGDVRVVTVANGVTAVTAPARVRGETNAVDLGLSFPDVPAGVPITMSAQLGSLYVDLPLDPAANAPGASSHEVRLDPWADEDVRDGTTFRTVASADGREMLVVGTVPQWVDDPVVELVASQDLGFVLPGAATAVDRVQVPTFDAPGDGTGRVYAAVVTAESAASRASLRIDDLRLVPVVTGTDGTAVVGGECAGREDTRSCLRDTVRGAVDLGEAATVEVARGVTATTRIGALAARRTDRAPRFDLGISVLHAAMRDRLVLAGSADTAPGSTSVPAPVALDWLGALPDTVWTSALGGSRRDAAVDTVSTTTSYTAVEDVWVITGTAPGSVDPDALARIELSAPVVRADGSRGTTVEVPTFDPVLGDGRRAFVAVISPASGLPTPESGTSPLAPEPTTFVTPRG